jgi:hypothetical protein
MTAEEFNVLCQGLITYNPNNFLEKLFKTDNGWFPFGELGIASPEAIRVTYMQTPWANLAVIVFFHMFEGYTYSKTYKITDLPSVRDGYAKLKESLPGNSVCQ